MKSEIETFDQSFASTVPMWLLVCRYEVALLHGWATLSVKYTNNIDWVR